MDIQEEDNKMRVASTVDKMRVQSWDGSGMQRGAQMPQGGGNERLTMIGERWLNLTWHNFNALKKWHQIGERRGRRLG